MNEKDFKHAIGEDKKKKRKKKKVRRK